METKKRDHVFVEDHQEEEHPTKKRRLFQKLSPVEIARRFADVNWQTVMQTADSMAPRVGPVVIEEGDIVQWFKDYVLTMR